MALATLLDQLAVVVDESSGLRAFVALHDTSRGPAFGGIRRRRYASEADALADVVALARAMTLKCALAGLPAGGAKTVIVDHEALDVGRAYQRLGDVIDGFGGRYVCGPDVGTGDGELASVRARTRHVNPLGNDAGASTAAGVVAGLRGVVRFLDGGSAAAAAGDVGDRALFGGRTFVVQGLGAVGRRVAATLVEAGARVLVHDVDDRALAAAVAAGATALDASAVLTTPCDVFVPCALGGVVTEAGARTLPARAVCGAANNQLATALAGAILAERGVVYAPDVAVNAGAVIEGVLTVTEGDSPATRAAIRRRIEDTEGRLLDLLERARAMGQRPEVQVSVNR